MTATATAAPAPQAEDPSLASVVLQQITTPPATGAGAAVGGGALNDAPLFEVKLELTETEIRFSPAFDASVENNFQQIVEQLLLDIKQTCDCMPRIVADSALSEDDEDDDGDGDDTAKEDDLEQGQGQELEQELEKELKKHSKPQAVQFNLLAAAKEYSQKMECTGMAAAFFLCSSQKLSRKYPASVYKMSPLPTSCFSHFLFPSRWPDKAGAGDTRCPGGYG